VKIPRILVVPIWVAILAGFGVLVGLIAKWLGAYSPNAWGFFSAGGVLLLMILYVWFRQIWWFVSGTGDYEGRTGLLKRLWKKIFKK
jgi:hypothetical protein